MHYAQFAIKRAHLAGMHISRPIAKTFGLTPARYDLMFAVRLLRRINVSALARHLTVVHSVTSRMVASLQALGLVTTTRSGRFTFVTLTDAGKAVLRRAYRALRRGQPLVRAYRRPFGVPGDSVAAHVAKRALDAFSWSADRLARVFAPMIYSYAFHFPDTPWRPTQRHRPQTLQPAGSVRGAA